MEKHMTFLHGCLQDVSKDGWVRSEVKEEEQSGISFLSRAVSTSDTIVSYRIPCTLDNVDGPVQRVAKCILNRHTKENGQHFIAMHFFFCLRARHHLVKPVWARCPSVERLCSHSSKGSELWGQAGLGSCPGFRTASDASLKTHLKVFCFFFSPPAQTVSLEKCNGAKTVSEKCTKI